MSSVSSVSRPRFRSKAGSEPFATWSPPSARPLASPSRTIARFRRIRTPISSDTHRHRRCLAGAALDRLQVALDSLPRNEERQPRAAKRGQGGQGGQGIQGGQGGQRTAAEELLESIKTSSSLAMAVPFIAIPLVPFGSLSLSILSPVSSSVSGAFAELSKNYVFSCGFVGWFCAQALKIFTKWYKTGVCDPMAFFDSGGMPSSHSSLCAAVTMAVAIHHGLASSLFAVCTCFTVIVMYDAMGVRRHAGLQAQVLNAVVGDLLEDHDGHPASGGRKLKEVLGHTPRQVMMGGLLGVLVGLVFPH